MNLIQQFEKIGAKLVIMPATRGWNFRRPEAPQYDLNILKDAKHGEHFRLILGRRAPTSFRVLQANAAARHLLLHVDAVDRSVSADRFLCGHDERHWFAAAIAGSASTITEAKRSLLPDALRNAGLSADDLSRRHGDKFIRQGEWFFIPAPNFAPDGDWRRPILRNEPLIRARGSKPHVIEEVVRFGGTEVVVTRSGQEYTPAEWNRLLSDGKVMGGAGQRMMKDPEVYARGRVRHPDHATIILRGWHRVYPNNEARSRNLSFYD